MKKGLLNPAGAIASFPGTKYFAQIPQVVGPIAK
jgi:hypothetical protein